MGITITNRRALVGALTAVALVAGLLFSLAAPAANAQAALTEAQIQSILSLLSSFGADQATINNVNSALRGQATGGTTGGGIASAACPFTWTRDLTSGSSGVDVQKLQQFLNSMPDTQVAAAGVGSLGQETQFFGPLTATAVSKFQNKYASEVLTPLGLASGTGYFGASSRAKANSLCTGTPATPGTPGTPGQTPTPGVGTEGSLTVTLESSPSNGTDVDKGDTEEVAAIELEADDSDLTINRVDINFNKRLWQYIESLELLDGNTVVFEDDNLSSSDFTEITEASDYRYRITGLNVVVPEGTKKVLTLRVTALADTDKTATTITVTFKANSVRGSDTAGFIQEEPNAALSGRTFDFKAETNGNVVATLNANSPDDRNVRVTNTGETEGVELMRFDIEAEHQDIDINSLIIDVGTNGGADPATLFDEVYLADSSGNKIASASTIATSTTFSTSDLEGLDEMKTTVGTITAYRLMADIADADDFTSGDGVSTTLTANGTNIVAEDVDFDTATVESATVTGGDLFLYQNVANFSNESATASVVGDDSYLANVTMKFTVTATGGDIFVSKTPATFVSTSTTASGTDTGGAPSTGLFSITASGGTAGDTSSAYKITSGSSRTFTFSGSVDNLNGTAGSKEFKITQINWADDSTNLTEFNNAFNLEDLEVNPTLTAT